MIKVESPLDDLNVIIGTGDLPALSRDGAALDHKLSCSDTGTDHRGSSTGFGAGALHRNVAAPDGDGAALHKDGSSRYAVAEGIIHISGRYDKLVSFNGDGTSGDMNGAFAIQLFRSGFHYDAHAHLCGLGNCRRLDSRDAAFHQNALAAVKTHIDLTAAKGNGHAAALERKPIQRHDPVVDGFLRPGCTGDLQAAGAADGQSALNSDAVNFRIPCNGAAADGVAALQRRFRSPLMPLIPKNPLSF